MPPLLTGLAMLAWMCRRPVAAWWGAGLLALLLLFWPVSLWGMEKISARAANWIIFWLRPWGPFVGSGSLLCCRVWIALEKNREPGEKAG